MSIEVQDNPDQNRFEARSGGELAGIVEYQVAGETIVFVHTETDPAFAGRGVGSALARTALDEARARGLAVVPQCPFIKSYIDKHEQYADLVA